MPAAAVMFRQGHVREARATFRLDLSRESLYYANNSPDTSAAIRTLVEQSKLTIGLPDLPELAWDDTLSAKSANATSVSDLGRDFVPPGQSFVVSDTGELRRDWALGIETIDTPLSQAAMGWIGGRSIALADVTFEIETPKAAVAVTSLDGRPIATSDKMLVTVVAQVAASPGERLPFLSQPVDGTIAVRARRPLRLVPVAPSDQAKPAAAQARGDRQAFSLGGAPTHWFMLVP
jgi:hypothetical protein